MPWLLGLVICHYVGSWMTGVFRADSTNAVVQSGHAFDVFLVIFDISSAVELPRLLLLDDALTDFGQV